jgi:hypothetical protein
MENVGFAFEIESMRATEAVISANKRTASKRWRGH